MNKLSEIEDRITGVEIEMKNFIEELRATVREYSNDKQKETPSSIKDYANPMSWVKTWEDICECAKIDPKQFAQMWSILDEDEFAYKQLKVITKVITNGHIFNFDTNEEKWYILWNLSPSGFAFSDTRYRHWRTDTAVAARLLFRTKIEAEFAGRTFPEIYKKYIKQ